MLSPDFEFSLSLRFFPLTSAPMTNDDHRFTILKRSKYTIKATKAVALST